MEVDPLVELRELVTAQRQMVSAIEQTAVRARRGGASWPEIAAACGVTPQAVSKRFGRVGRPDLWAGAANE